MNILVLATPPLVRCALNLNDNQFPSETCTPLVFQKKQKSVSKKQIKNCQIRSPPLYYDQQVANDSHFNSTLGVRIPRNLIESMIDERPDKHDD